jgi:hypothetical protein
MGKKKTLLQAGCCQHTTVFYDEGTGSKTEALQIGSQTGQE